VNDWTVNTYMPTLYRMIAIILLVFAVSNPRAHKPISSKYTYSEDVYPIFLEHCGSCHSEDGVGPMSLLTYGDAYPWAQSIKEEIINLSMPPWSPEEGFGAFKHRSSLTAHELNVLVDWSNGGTPEGLELDNVEPPVPGSTWTLGDPSLVLEIPENFSIGPATSDAIHYFVLNGGRQAKRWVTAVDVRPGNASIVRSVQVYVDTTGRSRTLDAEDDAPGFILDELEPEFPIDQIIGIWVAGQSAIQTDFGLAYYLPAESDLVARIHYKKTWLDEGLTVEDRTAIGMHFSDASDLTPIKSLAVGISGVADTTLEMFVNYEQIIDESIELLSLIPEIDSSPLFVQLEAILPTGKRTPIVRLAQPRPAWRTRHWLKKPMLLPAGTRLHVSAIYPTIFAAENMSSLGFNMDVVPKTQFNLARNNQVLHPR